MSSWSKPYSTKEKCAAEVVKIDLLSQFVREGGLKVGDLVRFTGSKSSRYRDYYREVTDIQKDEVLPRHGRRYFINGFVPFDSNAAHERVRLEMIAAFTKSEKERAFQWGAAHVLGNRVYHQVQDLEDEHNEKYGAFSANVAELKLTVPFSLIVSRNVTVEAGRIKDTTNTYATNSSEFLNGIWIDGVWTKIDDAVNQWRDRVLQDEINRDVVRSIAKSS